MALRYLSMMTGSEGVSFRFPQLFLSQHRLKENRHGQYEDVQQHSSPNYNFHFILRKVLLF